jgi:RNA polymerase sigma-70 factor (ECF subfamily)
MRPDDAELPPGFTAALAQAEEAWAGVEIERSAAVRYLLERLPADATVESVNVVDLYLACACVHGHARALAILDEMLTQAMKPVTSIVGDTDDVLETRQRLAERLLVDAPDRPAKLRSYRGAGPLRGWLRVCLTREALTLQRRVGPASAPEALERVVEVAADPELALLKANAREVFRTAFSEAVASLSARERNVLRHQIVAHLSVEEIGRMYGVNKSTITRWSQKARQSLLAQTRRRMLLDLNVGREEFEQLFGLIRSNLDLSFSRHLDPSPEDP